MSTLSGSRAAWRPRSLLAACGWRLGRRRLGARARTIAVTLTDAGCRRQSCRAPAGPTTFEVTNDGGRQGHRVRARSTATDPRRGREHRAGPLRELLAHPAQPGRFTTYCPGGTTRSAALRRHGRAGRQGRPPRAPRPSARYRALRRGADGPARGADDGVHGRRPRRRRRGGQAPLRPARVPYERIEPVAESFGDLDPAIDARAGDVPSGEWTGFHPIEQALWVEGTTSGHGARRRQAAGRRQGPAATGRTSRARARPDRERRRRAARRGLEVEDHRRGGALLAHRPRRLRGERRGREGRVRVRAPDRGRDDPRSRAEIDERFAAVDAALEPTARATGSSRTPR